MKITYHSHACFSIHTSTAHLLIDPYLSDNPLAQISPSQINPDYILVTHAHADHFGDTLSIAKNGATIITSAELAQYCSEQNMPSVHSMQVGGGYNFPFGYVKMTPATHGSSLSIDGKVVVSGSPAGFLIKADGKTIYHAGDTGLTAEMQILAQYEQIDLAILPIGGNFTMDIPDAIRALQILKPKYTIPMHYNTFPVIKQNPQIYKTQAQNLGINCQVLDIEQSFTF